MQTLEIKVEEQYIDNILIILKNLKEGMIKEIKVKDSKEFEEWSNKELVQIGKIGFVSKSFVEDSEDYSKW